MRQQPRARACTLARSDVDDVDDDDDDDVTIRHFTMTRPGVRQASLQKLMLMKIDK